MLTAPLLSIEASPETETFHFPFIVSVASPSTVFSCLPFVVSVTSPEVKSQLQSFRLHHVDEVL